jgi:hypothetical protein
VDKAYITYKPNYAKFLKLEIGKSSYPWYRTALTFDNDVNPEGFSQTASFDIKSDIVKNVTFVGFQLPINESSSGIDSWIFGGQAQVKYQLGSKAKLSFYITGVHFENADIIATSQYGSSPSLKPSLSNTNALRYSDKNAVLGYANKFAYLDTIVKLDIATSQRFPTMIQFDYVQNTEISKENNGYWLDFMVGRTQEAKDVQLGYSYIRIEKEAVIGAFNESDLRAPTGIQNHRLLFSYLFAKNVSGNFTAWIGKKVNVTPEDKTLKRLQFDLVYKF